MRDVRPELAEALGTAFMLLAGGTALLAGLPGWPAALAFGGSVALLVVAFGRVSGAHFNPAVTLAFAAAGHFPWRRVLPYAAAQLAGALLACAALLAVGDLDPAVAGGSGFAAEVAATFALALTISLVATGRPLPRGVAGAAIGLAVTAGALAAAAMNPARALAPALLAGDVDGLLPRVAGPLVGGALGMAAHRLARLAPRRAAAGDA